MGEEGGAGGRRRGIDEERAGLGFVVDESNGLGINDGTLLKRMQQTVVDACLGERDTFFPGIMSSALLRIGSARCA